MRFVTSDMIGLNRVYEDQSIIIFAIVQREIRFCLYLMIEDSGQKLVPMVFDMHRKSSNFSCTCQVDKYKRIQSSVV